MTDSANPWFYVDSQGTQQGPVRRTSIEGLWAAGDLRRDTLVWTSGMTEWAPLESIFKGIVPPPVPAHAQAAAHATMTIDTPPIPTTNSQTRKSSGGSRALMLLLLVAMCTLISFFLRTGSKAWLMMTEYPYLAVMGLAEALGYSIISIGIGAILITKDKVQAAFVWAGLTTVVFAFLPTS